MNLYYTIITFQLTNTSNVKQEFTQLDWHLTLDIAKSFLVGIRANIPVDTSNIYQVAFPASSITQVS